MERCPCETKVEIREGENTAPPSGALVVDAFAAYPRVVRLSRDGRLLLTFDGGQNTYPIFESRDSGHTWSTSPLSEITDLRRGPGSCCAALFEVPPGVVGLAAGTLLFAAAFGKDPEPRCMAIELWRSEDNGCSWQPHATARLGEGGVWEPEFVALPDGRLGLYYADETLQPEHSQTVALLTSADGGRTWSEPRHLLADGEARPGMPVVRRLPGGRFLMVYELCGRPGADNCAVYAKFSPNVETWGGATDWGERVVSSEGRFFAGTPNLALAPDGRLFLVGQRLKNADGSPAAGSGRTLFVSQDEGRTWTETPAPVAVPNPPDEHFCPNYSPALLVSPDGTELLEVTTGFLNGECRAFSAAVPLPGTLGSP